jgi:hypothetical protein
MRRNVPALLVAVFLMSGSQWVAAQEDLPSRIDQLGKRIDQLEAKQRPPVTEIHRDAGGAAILLFGAFCALWAQNTNRNAWLWFFLGVFFNVITVLVLLAKNSGDRRKARGEPAASGSVIAVAIVVGVLVLLALGAIIAWALVRYSAA